MLGNGTPSWPLPILCCHGTKRLTILNATEACRKASEALEPRRTTECHFLDLVAHRIEAASAKGHTEMTFAVPSLEIGMPLDDVTQVHDAVVEALRQHGCMVQRIGPHGMHVEWSQGRNEDVMLVV